MFIDRNGQGEIVGWYAVQQYGGQEFVEGAAPPALDTVSQPNNEEK